jgi:dethiobiotin synthetase
VPDQLVVVSGTGTGVGKTWVAAQLAQILARRGVEVAARKPVQSFDPAEGPSDASLLALATGEAESAVCAPHRSYPAALAPPLAAEALGRPSFRIIDLLAELVLPAAGVVVLEGVGGARSPLADDGDTVALADALVPDLVVVVSGSGLGAINDVLLTTAAFRGHRTAVYLNRFDPGDPVHASNLSWLRRRAPASLHTSTDSLAEGLLQAGAAAR